MITNGGSPARDHIMVPAPVAARVVRDPQRQARLMLTLRSCDIVPFEPEPRWAGRTTLASSGTSDVVDGFVAVKAAEMARDSRHFRPARTSGICLARLG